MQPPLPSVTPTWRNDTYEAISPSRPELSAAGKTVIVAGAGSGIGRETALAFAAAGAARVSLLGRTEAAIAETAASLPSSVQSDVHAVDITDEQTLIKVAAAIGKWDILVLASGYVSSPSPVAGSATDDWWQSFETNTKGTYLVTKVFLPTANPSHASIVALTTGTTALPAVALPGLSAYMASKLAQTKIIEFLAAENPNIFAVTLHPGMVETDIFTKSGAKAEALPMDKVQLPAHFTVWLASPEAAFLNGRTVWANWDVEELKKGTGAIQSGQLLTSGINGWPYTSLA
ncbi:short chain dehydrogenase [Colletotrichum scovillei]|uniref:Short chain dehydrogenase n=1 Tax=Colletotrichum scovillei TaxID=1209932 RepID=A0A9P7UAP1_9PEZI|nr:short chain dehydrogenase [Colletotrichum scovillei]KAF4776428.1 short chain dehydrogenase [Colletotrichum scovillei]KAG7047441.1 short chain dehydrogenase [Colletotrichum scovillei]KAG7059760.1 short chain dehydrogenase [Colletotrichum scovillei]KAG7067206.1 short chain dehydrogenase [Colletotrichum scovillei]